MQTEESQGLRAVCHQHEIDQLNGLFWIQRLSRLKRERLIKRFEKVSRGEMACHSRCALHIVRCEARTRNRFTTQLAARWISGSRQARPGMTGRGVKPHAGTAAVRATGTGRKVSAIRKAPSPMTQEPI